MRDFIAIEIRNDAGRYLKVEKELIRCSECIHGVVTATLEKRGGDLELSYMCKHWLAPTAEDGYCHQGRFKDVQKIA